MDLGGTIVPKDKIIVYIFIGNSQMQGAAEDPDNVTHPRVWNYHIPDADTAFTGWEPAKDAFHRWSDVYWGGGCLLGRKRGTASAVSIFGLMLIIGFAFTRHRCPPATSA